MLKKTIAALAACALGLASAAQAATIYDSGGFELPRFVSQLSVVGQDPITNGGPWFQFTGSQNLDALVTTTNPNGGTQAVQLTRNGSSIRVAPFIPQVPLADRYLFVNWDMRVEQSSGPSSQFGPVFGVQIYDQVGTGPTATVRQVGALFVDSFLTTGNVLVTASTAAAPTTGFLTDTGATASLGAYNSYQIIADYQTKTYAALLNGVQVYSGNFVNGAATGFTDADLAGLAGAGDAASLAAVGTSFFDNYVISTGNAIPEPTSLGLLSLAGIGLLRRRR